MIHFFLSLSNNSYIYWINHSLHFISFNFLQWVLEISVLHFLLGFDFIQVMKNWFVTTFTKRSQMKMFLRVRWLKLTFTYVNHGSFQVYLFYFLFFNIYYLNYLHGMKHMFWLCHCMLIRFSSITVSLLLFSFCFFISTFVVFLLFVRFLQEIYKKINFTSQKR